MTPELALAVLAGIAATHAVMEVRRLRAQCAAFADEVYSRLDGEIEVIAEWDLGDDSDEE